MNRIATALVLGTGLVLATAVMAAEDPIAERQAIMKNNGAAARELSRMAKGEVEFSDQAALLAIRAINSGMMGYGHLFPEGSESSASKASADIWQNMDAFQELVTKLQADTSAAIESPPTSLEQVGPVLGTIGQTCSDCHERFRIKTN